MVPNPVTPPIELIKSFFPVVYASTNLAEFLAKKETFNWWNEAVEQGSVPRLILGWCVCIASALFTLHKAHIKHGDLIPENILIHLENGVPLPVLCNYDLSSKYSGSSPYYKSLRSQMYGAPEQDTNRKVGREADIFSFGAVLLELFALLGGVKLRKLRDFSTPSFARSITNGHTDAIIDLFPADSAIWLECRSILEGPLALDPQERTTSQKLWEQLDAIAPHSHCTIPEIFPPLSDEGLTLLDSSSDSDDEMPAAKFLL
ncbi:kinase-like domain-containing protein [Phlyctochytrium arcticum]|nr:kinase-like domain-containing protein [Phlyctochytrium arcticum]